MQPPTPHSPADGGGSEYLTVQQAADRLNVSKRFVEHLIRTEQLPVHRFGRSVRVKTATLDQVAESAATKPLRSTRQPGPSGAGK